MNPADQIITTQYFINSATRTALVRISPTVCQQWQAMGKTVSADSEFDHRHWQSIYPSKDRLDEYIHQKFEPATLEDYLAIQFEHHQLDDFFRAKANTVKQSLFEQRINNQTTK